MKLLVCFALSAVMGGASNAQTVVIAKIYNGKIYVGADTKQANIAYNEKKKRYDTSVAYNCKIFTRGKYNYAVSGHFPELQISMANDVINYSNSINYILNYKDRYLNSLIRSLDSLKRFYPRTYAATLADYNQYSETIFFSFEIDRLYLTGIKCFAINNKGEGCNCIIETGNIIAAGEVEEIKTMVQDERYWKDGIINTMNKLIKIEAGKHPAFVGGENDIVELSPFGFKRLQESGKCH